MPHKINFSLIKPDKPLDGTIKFLFMPNEMIMEIGSFLKKPVDIANFRMINKRYSQCLETTFFKALADSPIIYARYASFNNFLNLLNFNPVLRQYVHNIVLVGEALREHEYGYAWAWENVTDCEVANIMDEDINIMNTVDQAHAADLTLNGPFVNGGGYRTMLHTLLTRLPNLRTIEVRKLFPGEHLPGWDGPDALKDLSFYRKGLNTNPIFYGDWQYDTLHLRVTVHKDEFGDEIAEPTAGPQARFIDDVEGAINTSGTTARVIGSTD
ncbi:uncharacterized protein K460DRAFT_361390 [Cucurbitaria berberidis CBS 394.84]|uniref:F-box domain-containing protein n=1 Tax=Cucurbitaria berberidis CBS 394.84 TaxID=1168544 RepID=A0A9P4GSC7_9PLEO|nr:uncharacterized protein K460DRAFT_361390 [Cucurbitaria berberidis CBS 394.84]KAF1850634.1 hypothetical protein K460DRAFT_361390 [Cucurbitaria berberidis CBS 394.84]